MRLDITKMEGYRDDLSAEEKLALYEKAEIDLSGYVSKSTADKYASEAAEYKRKYNTTLSEQERKAEEENEARSKMEKELADLKRERLIDRNTAELLKIGFSNELAESGAKALADGNLTAVFESMAKHMKAFETNLRAEMLKSTPKPPSGIVGRQDTATMLKQVEEAQARGDYAAAAYYNRLAEQAKQTE